MTQLEIWRIQASNRLETLIAKLQDTETKHDELIDDLIRALSKLPARPSDKPAYVGIFAIADVMAGRKKAAEQLGELICKLTGECGPHDALIDDLIRALSQLPARPADKLPYVGIFPETKMVLLTPQQLHEIAPEASTSRVTELAPHLNLAMLEFNITTPLRQAHFLAQLAHESDRFNALEEYASGEDYEWRDDLGNVEAGDGVRFKGRGLIQVTGRANYERCGKALGVDLINNPTKLAKPDLACRSAGWFWKTNQLNGDADNDDVRTVTRVINGGYNGLDDRIQLLEAAKKALKI